MKKFEVHSIFPLNKINAFFDIILLNYDLKRKKILEKTCTKE